jgi:hypothetical protein
MLSKYISDAEVWRYAIGVLFQPTTKYQNTRGILVDTQQAMLQSSSGLREEKIFES